MSIETIGELTALIFIIAATLYGTYRFHQQNKEFEKLFKQ